MNRHVSTSNARRSARGPSIQLLDGDEPTRSDDTPARSTASKGSGLRILPAPQRARGLGWVSRVALFVAAVGMAAVGFAGLRAYLAADEPVVAAAVRPAVEPILVQAQPEAPSVPPPTESELAALESGAEDAMGEALRALRRRDVTAAGLRAVAIAARRTTDVELLRRAACYRVRGGAPLAEAFALLPTTPAADVEWTHDGAACLVEAIAARATDAPERALPVLVDRALIQDTDALLDGLAQLNLPALPVSVIEALQAGGPSRSRRAAIRVAIAMGGAAKWPERVQGWLDDRDRGVRLLAHAELLRQRDDASLQLAAQAVIANPADDELRRRGIEHTLKGEGFDRAVAALAGDPSQPADVRARAADLVAVHGGPAACRLLVALADAEPALASELAETRLRIDRRFGFRLGRPARPSTAPPLVDPSDSGAD